MRKPQGTLEIDRTRKPPPYGVQAIQFMQTLNQMGPRILVTDKMGRTFSLEEGLTETMGRIVSCCQKGNKLMFIGNGGSAAISSHLAMDYWKNGGLEAITFNDGSLLTCLSNDYGFERVFAEPIQRFARAGDLLLAISSSGKSPNILRAVEKARVMKCGVMTFSGFDPSNPLRILGDMNFFVPSTSYGVVEITHLTLLHAILESHISSKYPPRKENG